MLGSKGMGEKDRLVGYGDAPGLLYKYFLLTLIVNLQTKCVRFLSCKVC